MGQPKPPWQVRLCWSGFAAILLFVFLPSAYAVSCHARRVALDWVRFFWFAPSTYVYAVSSLLAILFPIAAALKCTPLLRAGDATFRVVLFLNTLYFVTALGGALFWQFVAWLSYPMQRDGLLRVIPLWPWPDWPFFSQFLCF